MELKREIRGLWQVIFLDGRNENGTHLLWMPGSTLPDRHLYDGLSGDEAEFIMKQAEEYGHEAGHCIVTMWRAIDPGDDTYDYEFIGYSEQLTNLICGSPDEQKKFIEAA